MGKSLEVSSRGLDFERFMKTLVRVPKEAIDKTLDKGKHKKKAPPKGR